MNERLAYMASAAKELSRKMDDGSLVREVLQEHEEDIRQYRQNPETAVHPEFFVQKRHRIKNDARQCRQI